MRASSKLSRGNNGLVDDQPAIALVSFWRDTYDTYGCLTGIFMETMLEVEMHYHNPVPMPPRNASNPTATSKKRGSSVAVAWRGGEKGEEIVGL